MQFVCKVLKKTEAVEGDELTIGFPDENGQILTISGEAEGDLNDLIPGEKYTIAFIPFVAQSDPVAVPPALDVTTTPDQLVPADHDLVLDPVVAATVPVETVAVEAAPPVDVIAPPAAPVEVPVVTETAPVEVTTAADQPAAV